VGHNEPSLASVGRAEGSSRHTEHPDFVTECFKVTDNVGKHRAIKSRHVLANDPPRANLGNEAAEVGPQVALVVCALALAGNAVRLARESSDDGVNHGKVACGECSDIVVPRHVGPVFGEHFERERLALNLRGALPPGALKAEVEAADAGEKRKELHASPLPAFSRSHRSREERLFRSLSPAASMTRICPD